MDRVQIGAIALAIGLLIFWFIAMGRQAPPSRVTEAPEIEAPGLPAPEVAQQAEPPIPPQLKPGFDDAPRYDAVGASKAVLENDAVRLTVSSIGGRLERVELKDFRARLGRDSGPVELVTSAARGTGLVLAGNGDRVQGLGIAKFEVIGW